MDPMKKPEWFELVEKDGGKPNHPVKRGFRALALTIPLMVIGVGVVVAQSSDESPASAETTSIAAPATPQYSDSATTPTQPAIAQPPSAPTDDDDAYEGEHDEFGEDD